MESRSILEKILVVIPAFNEEENIEKLILKLKKILPLNNVLVIDDGSKDGTYNICLKYKGEGLKILKNDKNIGKGGTLRRGFKYALKNHYQGVITLDADLQHPPELIKKFIEKLKTAKCDMIIGSRKKEFSKMKFDRYLSNRLTTLFLSLLVRKKLLDSQSGFRYISTKILKKLNLRTSNYQTESEILIQSVKKGFKICWVDIPVVFSKSSKIDKLKDTLRFIKMFMYYAFV